jgi:heme exporter protein D
MNWNSASEFWAMGGYGLYVWGSFGVTALVMGLEVVQAFNRQKHIRESLTKQAAVQDSAQDWQA